MALGAARRSEETSLPDIPFALIAAGASVSVFAPLAAWLAAHRERSPLLWALFGACLGPVAAALLVAAPPSRCPACGWRVSGWPTVCAACGVDLATGAPDGHGSDAAPAPAPVTTPRPFAPSASAGTSPSIVPVLGAAAGRATSSTGSTSVRGDRPGGVRGARTGVDWDETRPIGTLQTDKPTSPASPASHEATELGRRPNEPVAGIGAVGTDSTAGPEPAPAVRPTGSAVATMQREPSTSGTPDFGVLGSGVFVGGNRSLQPGSRYLLARMGSQLHVLGPMHVNPAFVADRIWLPDVDVITVDDRLVLGTRGGRGDVALAFVGVTAQPGISLERALRAVSAEGR